MNIKKTLLIMTTVIMSCLFVGAYSTTKTINNIVIQQIDLLKEELIKDNKDYENTLIATVPSNSKYRAEFIKEHVDDSIDHLTVVIYKKNKTVSNREYIIDIQFKEVSFIK